MRFLQCIDNELQIGHLVKNADLDESNISELVESINKWKSESENIISSSENLNIGFPYQTVSNLMILFQS